MKTKGADMCLDECPFGAERDVVIPIHSTGSSSKDCAIVLPIQRMTIDGWIIDAMGLIVIRGGYRIPVIGADQV